MSMRWTLVAFALASAPSLAFADGARSYHVEPYLRDVARGNADLAAQRFNVSIAQAQVSIAKVFPDPVVTGGLLQYDVTQQNPTASIVSISVPVQIAGQRGARIRVAEAGADAANADLEDFLRTLRASAANAFVESLHARLVLERRRQTLASLTKLVEANQERVSAGDIGDRELVQSRGRRVGVVHHHRLGDLERQPVRGESGLLERATSGSAQPG